MDLNSERLKLRRWKDSDLEPFTRPSFESWFTPCVEVGWRIAFEHWETGYAPEAANSVIQFAFNNLKLSEILSWTAKDNIRSCRVMEKIGMQRDLNGDFDHPKIPDGHRLRPHVLYRIQVPTELLP